MTVGPYWPTGHFLFKMIAIIINALCSVIEPAGETPALRKQRDVVKALSPDPQALDDESYYVSI